LTTASGLALTAGGFVSARMKRIACTRPIRLRSIAD